MWGAQHVGGNYRSGKSDSHGSLVKTTDRTSPRVILFLFFIFYSSHTSLSFLFCKYFTYHFHFYFVSMLNKYFGVQRCVRSGNRH
jgi:hypothetical protein